MPTLFVRCESAQPLPRPPAHAAFFRHAQSQQHGLCLWFAGTQQHGVRQRYVECQSHDDVIEDANEQFHRQRYGGRRCPRPARLLLMVSGKAAFLFLGFRRESDMDGLFSFPDASWVLSYSTHVYVRKS